MVPYITGYELLEFIVIVLFIVGVLQCGRRAVDIYERFDRELDISGNGNKHLDSDSDGNSFLDRDI